MPIHPSRDAACDATVSAVGERVVEHSVVTSAVVDLVVVEALLAVLALAAEDTAALRR